MAWALAAVAPVAASRRRRHKFRANPSRLVSNATAMQQQQQPFVRFSTYGSARRSLPRYFPIWVDKLRSKHTEASYSNAPFGLSFNS
jgi:hypothetical protein